VEGGEYTITLSGDEAVGPKTLSYSGKTVCITLSDGTAGRTVSLDSNGPLFAVGSGVALVLDNNITLRGWNYNTDALVRVNNGGALIMKAGSKINGDANSSSSGGGVYVVGGTFTKQSGGIIYGSDANDASQNTAMDGGHAVYVYSVSKRRDTTAGEGVTLDSGSAGG
jgi:hypothetical protein